jgi:hypothetical protein
MSPVTLPGNCSQSPTLSLRTDGYSLYALHEYYGSSYSVQLAKSTDSGANWTATDLDGPSMSLGSVGSSMAISGLNQYVVYSTGGSHANGYSITLKKSIDGGASW